MRRIIRINNDDVFYDRLWGNIRLYNLDNKEFAEGPITLSLKYKKRRRLVSGRLEHEYDYHDTYEGGYYVTHVFVPNNLEKINNIFSH